MDNDNKNIVVKPVKAVVTNQISKKNNNLAITSLVLGIMSILLCWALVYPIIVGLIGIIIGLVSLAKKREGTGIAIAGTIISVIGLLIGILFIIIYMIGTFVSY